MQGNNNLRVFSGNTSNYIADADLDGAVVQSGAVNGGVAASNLYNSLSLTTTLACTSLIDFVAQYNPNITFGQTTPIDTWITAVGNAIASKTSVDNIVNGTTTVGNATNVTTNINGNAISNIFESNGTTVKNATNATNVNITNLDNGNNAVVNFKLGNGTSYDKTINNVANANTVQNVDFSSDSNATFGNYTVEKVLILNSSQISIPPLSVISLNGNLSTGDIVRFLVRFPESSFKYIYTRVPVISTSANNSIIADCVSGTNMMRVDTLNLTFSSQNEITLNSISYYQIMDGSFSGGESSCTIIEIAKII